MQKAEGRMKKNQVADGVAGALVEGAAGSERRIGGDNFNGAGLGATGGAFDNAGTKAGEKGGGLVSAGIALVGCGRAVIGVMAFVAALARSVGIPRNWFAGMATTGFVAAFSRSARLRSNRFLRSA